MPRFRANRMYIRIPFFLLVLTASLPLPAHAVLLTTFDFVGNCIDCAEEAGQESFEISASITLQDYVSGTQLASDDFYSFTYSGSNLVTAFTITEQLWNSGKNQVLNGSLPFSIGGALDFQMRLIHTDTDLWACTELGLSAPNSGPACSHTRQAFFSISENGDWSFGAPPKDMGNNAVLNGPSVPEPATFSLLILALAGLGFQRRKAA